MKKIKTPIQYLPQKGLWTQDDYEQMNWHDVKIHAMGTVKTEYEFYHESDLVLDIDYIFEWVPEPPHSITFQFWVAPCTLVFQNPENFKWEFHQPQDFLLEYEIYALELLAKHPKPMAHYPDYCTYDWKMDLQGGTMTLTSTGLQQFVRRPPILCESQSLTSKERGNISFSKTNFLQKNDI